MAVFVCCVSFCFGTLHMISGRFEASWNGDIAVPGRQKQYVTTNGFGTRLEFFVYLEFGFALSYARLYSSYIEWCLHTPERCRRGNITRKVNFLVSFISNK